MQQDDQQLIVGKDAVVIGRVSGSIGEGSVVIGPTDDRGNTIINQPMAVGRGASAGPNSIAIGAFASAGNNSTAVLTKLLEEMRKQGNPNEDEKQYAIVQVQNAVESARKNDLSGVVKHLKSAGSWALNIAVNIGLEIWLKQNGIL